jgi:glycosyltransferase involved in cell wall biosynthesis
LEIQKLRRDIYQLREFLREQNLAHSVAHAIYSINGRLTLGTLEKLILLFDTFEGINGGRGWVNNSTWMRSLKSLTSSKIEDLRRKHRIEPFGDSSWIKAFTGGSDDHAGVFVGSTWTAAEGNSVEGFLESLRRGSTVPGGRSNDYRSLAFTTFKVAYDHSQSETSTGVTGLLVRHIAQMFFESSSLSLFDKIKFKTLIGPGRMRNDWASKLLYDLAERCMSDGDARVENRLDYAYEKISEILDNCLEDLFRSLSRTLKEGEVIPLVESLMGTVPGVLLALPFFTSLKYMYRERDLMQGLVETHAISESKGKRILWFSDTLNDLNGPSVTLKQIGWLSHEKGMEIKIVGSLAPEELPTDLPPNLVNLPYVQAFPLPLYDAYLMKVPSILKALEILTQYEPDEVYISTPGPVGLLGLLFGKLIKARCVGIYHTDYLQQAAHIEEDDSVLGALEDYIRTVYSAMDEVAVPTTEYMSILSHRGYDVTKMRLFRRGIDSKHFRPRPEGEKYLRERFGVSEGVSLLYTGRIAKDKRLDFLMDVFARLREKEQNLNLILTGSGPYLEELQRLTTNLPKVYFTGRQQLDVLPLIYSGSDLFVFPSTCDTFGMSVLEAQSCGLPAAVSDAGGPKEIVSMDETGWILPASDVDAWVKRILSVVEMIRQSPEEYQRIREASRKEVLERHDWERILKTYVEGTPLSQGKNDGTGSSMVVSSEGMLA